MEKKTNEVAGNWHTNECLLDIHQLDLPLASCRWKSTPKEKNKVPTKKEETVSIQPVKEKLLVHFHDRSVHVANLCFATCKKSTSMCPRKQSTPWVNRPYFIRGSTITPFSSLYQVQRTKDLIRKENFISEILQWRLANYFFRGEVFSQ